MKTIQENKMNPKKGLLGLARVVAIAALFAPALNANAKSRKVCERFDGGVG